VKIGIVGAGAVVTGYHLPVLSRLPGVTVSFICDVSLERARKVAADAGVQVSASRIADCPDVDAVLVATPVGVRDDVVAEAFQRGWHVFCEKPFAISGSQHDRFLNQADAAGRAIGVGLMRRYYACTHTAAAIVADGIFGRVQEVFAGEGGRARSAGRAPGWYQERRATAGGGALIEAGSHLVDQVFTILSIEDFELKRYEQILIGDVEFDARAEAILKRNDGSSIPARFAISKLLDLHNGIVIRFERAEVRLGSAPTSPVTITSRQPMATPLTVNPNGGTQNVFAAFQQEWLEFMKQCETGVPSRTDAKSARLFTRFLDACYEGAGTPNEPISVLEGAR